ncbi:kinase-like domain-containing protein [Mycena rebaudengoi]|nr:kinase-like domain-containing protein [Mycena rebaudengoi]
MFLSINPNFFAEVAQTVVNVCDDWKAVLTAPPDISHLVEVLVRRSSKSSSNFRVPVPSQRIQGLLFPYHPVSRARYPPPPPPSAKFTLYDLFVSPTFVPSQALPGQVDISSSRNVMISTILVAAALFILSACTICQTNNNQVSRGPGGDVRRPSATVRSLVSSAYARFFGAVKTTVHDVVFVGSLAYEAVVWVGLHLCAILLLWVASPMGRLLYRVGRRLAVSTRSTAYRLATEGVPWVLKWVSCLFIGVVLRAVRLVFHPKTAPQVKPEEKAPSPAPPRPVVPPAPRRPLPQWTKWIEIVLEGASRTGLQPRNIIAQNLLGSGGYGRVVKGLNVETGRAVAIKRVAKKMLGSSGEYLIVDEIRAMNRLRLTSNNPFPVLLGSFIDDHDYILVMEFCPGGTLLDKLRSAGGYLSRPLALFYGCQLLLAIQCLHKNGILHRDIKLDNILLDVQGNALLSDFGMAKVFNLNVKGGRAWELAKERGGDHFPLLLPEDGNPHVSDAPRGTNSYGAPEARMGKIYSYGIDYWSFAVCLYEMITGLLPFVIGPDGRYIQPMEFDIDANADDEVPLTPEERHFFLKVLDWDAEDRYSSVLDMKRHPLYDWDAMSMRTVPVPGSRMPISNPNAWAGRVGRRPKG